MSVTLILVLTIAIYAIYSSRKQILDLWRLNRRCKWLLKDLPGPPSLPFIGSAHLFKWNNVGLLNQYITYLCAYSTNPNTEFTNQLEAWARQYLLEVFPVTGLLKVWVGPVPIVFCGTHEAIRPILDSNVNISKPNQYDIISEWIGTGLLTSTNNKWLQRRRMLTPAFHFNILQSYQEVFGKQGKILVNLLEKECGHYFDAFPYIKRCALDIICETAMGTEMNSQTGGSMEYVSAVQRVSAIIWDYERFPWLWLKPIWYLSGVGFEFDRLVQLTNDFTRKVIANRKAAIGENVFDFSSEEEIKKKRLAFLDLLFSMQKANHLSDEDIREEVDTFMFEGHDTTSSGIGFTMWWLGLKPECQEKVHDELDKVFGDSDRQPTTDDLKQLVYLEKCVKESLRLTPSVPLIARRLAKDITIGNTTLPEGLTVVVVPMTAQRDPRSYDFPEDFEPEHFDSERIVGRDPYAYIPFSAGPRNCIGQKFALQEEKTVLSWIFRRFKVESQETWSENRPVPELILKPSNGFRVRLTKRETSI